MGISHIGRNTLNHNIFNRTVHSSTGSPVCINDVVTARIGNETTINAYDFGSELLKILF